MSNLTDIVGDTTSIAPKEPQPKLSEMDQLALENSKLEKRRLELEIMEKQANLQDLQERLAERELKRESKRQRSLTNGATLTSLDNTDTQTQKRCNHRKGGNGAHGVVGGQGDDAQFAVLKHTFANGDMWVRCLRCGKTWKPPVKEYFSSEQAFLKSVVEYETAINFQTRNVASGSVQFRFSDNGKFYREVTANSNLSKHVIEKR